MGLRSGRLTLGVVILSQFVVGVDIVVQLWNELIVLLVLRLPSSLTLVKLTLENNCRTLLCETSDL